MIRSEPTARCRLSLLGAALFFMAGASLAADSIRIDDREWARTTNGPDITWPDAETYCAELEMDGKSDWRLPTLEELETLHDPDAAAGIREPIVLDGCCLWTQTSLEDRMAEDGDEIAGSPDMYRWGFMFDGGLRYYAVHIFEDGQALCTRDD